MNYKLESAVLGFTVGDALGVPVEFNSREILKKDPVATMTGWGTHMQEKGTWSDDTSMTLCTMEALIKGYNLDNIMKQFVKWYKHGHWTPYGEVFDIGNTTRSAISKYSRTKNAYNCGCNRKHDNGNGSLMRILPLAFYLKDNEDKIDRYNKISKVSALTHAHKISKLACIIYVELTIKLLNELIFTEAYERTCIEVKNYLKEIKDSELEYTFSRILNLEIWEANIDDIKSTGYVVDTLESVIYCILKSKNYRETVLKAVNLGDDTDTVGAITGSLAGIVYGKDSIPTEWIDVLPRKEEIIELCDKFDKTLK